MLSEYNETKNILHRLSPERIVFILLLMLVTAFLWLPAYPPMTDVPQHAGQVGVLRSLLLGENRWSDQVIISYITPYWIGYGSWLLVSFFLPVSIAFKVVLTFFFLFFVGAFVQMRREFMAPAMLDWILIPSFFGFSYEWGFITFIFAVPIGVIFFLLNKRWEEARASKWGWLVLIAGLVMYFSHLLVFLFFCFLTPAYLMVRCRFQAKILWRFLPPYIIFAALFVAYFSMNGLSHGDGGYLYGSYGDHGLWSNIYERITGLLSYPFGMILNRYAVMTLSVAALLLPFILGYRGRREFHFYVPLLSLLIIWILLPHYSGGDGIFVFQRFSIFVFPFYILCFEKRLANQNIIADPVQRIGMGLGVLVIIALLYRPLANQWFFSKEAGEFASLLNELPAQQRAVTLVYSRGSRVVDNPFVYLHFPVWYQAEKGGWVDPSFAWSSQMVVRYRQKPSTKPGFEWNPRLISYIKDCDHYDLLFVRSFIKPPVDMFQNTPCHHILYKNKGDWYVYRLPYTIRR